MATKRKSYPEDPVAIWFFVDTDGLPHKYVIVYTPKLNSWGVREFFWSVEHQEWLGYASYMALNISGEATLEMIETVIQMVTNEFAVDEPEKIWVHPMTGDFIGEFMVGD